MRASLAPLRLLGWVLLGCLAAVGPVLAGEGRLVREPVGGELPPTGTSASAKALGDRLGGDGTRFGLPAGSLIDDMDIASNGDIYLAVAYDHPSDGEAIAVYRSTDGGATFAQWGVITSPSTSAVYRAGRLVLAEGVQDRCFVAFTSENTPGDDTIVVAWENLSSATAGFANRTPVLARPGDSFEMPDLAVDDESYSAYYLYLVGVGNDGNGRDIWFARSTDQGSSWDPAYELAASPLAAAGYYRPSISHGAGSHVHVAWDYASIGIAFPSAIRYMRADSDADGGLVAWGLLWHVTTTTNGFSDRGAKIVAAHDSDDVVLTYFRRSGTYWDTVEPPAARVANDQGDAGFSASAEVPIQEPGYLSGVSDLVRSPVTGDWYAALGSSRRIARANAATPASWSTYAQFEPQPPLLTGVYPRSNLAIDPSRGNRVAIILTDDADTGTPVGVFGAEWQADPGHPILEDGFPLLLQVPPVSDPALVDLDSDGDLEIVFGDVAGNIRAIQADGTELPGWPVEVGTLSSSPVACAELTLGDEMFVVAGTADGIVHAFLADGSPAPGWPVDLGTAAPVHVSIGALGGPYPLTVVAASGSRVVFLDHAGRAPASSYERYFPPHVATQPCAIGDIDDDGVAEVVVTMGSLVFGFERDTPGDEFGRGFPSAVSGPVTLGDSDLDGDLEIAVPTAAGLMHLIDHTGADVPGWPFDSGGDIAMRGAAWANVLGSDAPELALASQAWKLHLLDGDGLQQAGFPVNAGLGWYQHGSPVIGQVDGIFPDIVLGSSGSTGWAFNVIGNAIPGWPRQLGAPCRWTPAIGDIDLDGSNEVVLLTDDEVQVFDVRSAPLPPEFTWLMAGHDPQRTGCSDCAEDRVSAVGDPSAPAPTGVAFAAPYPNPASARTALSYSLPAAAQVKLQIFDVRGRLVRTLADGQQEAGWHEIAWNGTHANGRRVALGLYLAKLSVDGPGGPQERVRKISLVR